MAFVYPFPENINQYTENGLEKLLNYIEDNISYYKINIQDYNGEIYNVPVTNKEELKDFRNNLNEVRYILLSYNLYPRSIFPIEKEIRGIVFKNDGHGNFKCIARPLHKFYNVGEEIYIKSYIEGIEGVPDDDNEIGEYFKGGEAPTVEMKEDGAMIQVFLDENSELPNSIDIGKEKQLIFNTKNTLAKNIFVDDFVNNFEDKNEIVAGMYQLLSDISNGYNENATLIFEYVNPDLETHVVQYSQKQMYLIDIRLNESGRYLTYDEKVNIYNNYFTNTVNLSLVQKEDILSENELLNKREEQYIEGYVLKKFELDGEFFHYTKFKTKWYLNRGFYDGLDVVNFSLKDLLILYSLGEEDTFFQKMDNPKNTELLRKINIDPKEYKNFINEITTRFQDKIVDILSKLRMDFYYDTDDIIQGYGANYIIDKRFIYNELKNQENIIGRLYKKILLEILSKKDNETIPTSELIDIFSDNSEFINIIFDIIYKSVFNFDNSKGRTKLTKITNLVNSAVESENFSEWSDKILNKDANGNYIIISDKEELVKFLVHLLEKLYHALIKVSNQIAKKNFIFIFYNLVYEDIYAELEKEGIDRVTFNLILNNAGKIIGFDPDYNIPLILSEIYKYKNKIDPASELINKDKSKHLEKLEKDIYFQITKDPNVVNLLRLQSFDKLAYQRFNNIDENIILEFILSAIF